MVRFVMRAAAGLLALAAFSLPAVAEPSLISFVSGPLAGVAADNVKHEDDNNLVEGGTQATETAVFRGQAIVAWISWSRLSHNNIWQDDGLNKLTENTQKVFKASGTTITASDRITVNSFDVLYRNVDLTGTPQRCGVFRFLRGKDSIIGFACRRDGQAVPVPVLLEGLSIQGVISP
jgi:hypothetical protein